MDYYEILNIPLHASLKTIKLAYRELQKQSKTDENVKNNLPLINKAYTILKDPFKRHAYDIHWECENKKNAHKCAETDLKSNDKINDKNNVTAINTHYNNEGFTLKEQFAEFTKNPTADLELERINEDEILEEYKDIHKFFKPIQHTQIVQMRGKEATINPEEIKKSVHDLEIKRKQDDIEIEEEKIEFINQKQFNEDFNKRFVEKRELEKQRIANKVNNSDDDSNNDDLDDMFKSTMVETDFVDFNDFGNTRLDFNDDREITDNELNEHKKKYDQIYEQLIKDKKWDELALMRNEEIKISYQLQKP